MPDLFYVDCTNILWKYARRYGLEQKDARRFQKDLGNLALTAVPTANLMYDALAIALAHNITAYDASYVALAQGLSLPLFTADEKLVRVFSETSYDLRWIGNVSQGQDADSLSPPPSAN